MDGSAHFSNDQLSNFNKKGARIYQYADRAYPVFGPTKYHSLLETPVPSTNKPSKETSQKKTNSDCVARQAFCCLFGGNVDNQVKNGKKGGKKFEFGRPRLTAPPSNPTFMPCWKVKISYLKNSDAIIQSKRYLSNIRTVIKQVSTTKCHLTHEIIVVLKNLLLNIVSKKNPKLNPAHVKFREKLPKSNKREKLLYISAKHTSEVWISESGSQASRRCPAKMAAIFRGPFGGRLRGTQTETG